MDRIHEIPVPISEATMAMHITCDGASIGSFMNEMSRFLSGTSTWFEAGYRAALNDDGRRLVRQLAAAIDAEGV